MIILKEQNFSKVNVLSESTDSGSKRWYIEGVFAQADIINGNRRKYPLDVLTESMHTWKENYVDKGRAVGELNHPDTLKVNPERITQRITELRQDGNSFVGKALILDTPCGKILQGLMEGGVKMGVSTRAGGDTYRDKDGIVIVKEGLSMRAIDNVWDPSAPDAFVDGLMESDQFVWDTMGLDEALMYELTEDIKKAKKKEMVEAKFKAFKKVINNIR
jgi:hypothetical protein